MRHSGIIVIVACLLVGLVVGGLAAWQVAERRMAWRVYNVGSGKLYVVDNRTSKIWLIHNADRIPVEAAEW